MLKQCLVNNCRNKKFTQLHRHLSKDNIVREWKVYFLDINNIVTILRSYCSYQTILLKYMGTQILLSKYDWNHFPDRIHHQPPYKDWMLHQPTLIKKREYLSRTERLKTITSAPNLMVLVLNPLPSRNRHPWNNEK